MPVRTFEITTTIDGAREAVVIVRDEEMREVVRMVGLSQDHARRLAMDCAMILTKMSAAAIVLRVPNLAHVRSV